MKSISNSGILVWSTELICVLRLRIEIVDNELLMPWSVDLSYSVLTFSFNSNSCFAHFNTHHSWHAIAYNTYYVIEMHFHLHLSLWYAMDGVSTFPCRQLHWVCGPCVSFKGNVNVKRLILHWLRRHWISINFWSHHSIHMQRRHPNLHNRPDY